MNHANRKFKRVAVLVETTRSYGRNVLRGISDYSRLHGPWLFFLPLESNKRSVPPPEEWDGDGIIAQPHQDAEMVQALVDRGVPVVSLSGPPGAGGLPSSRSNNDAVIKLALRHFLDRGFKNFAYCGIPSERQWPPIGEMFRKLVEAEGYTCEVHYRAYADAARIMHLNEMTEWLKKLPRPIALLAGNDLRAREVLDACQLAGIHVPEEIAVLGISDDELICEMATPALSSVTHNSRRIGFEAAALLDRLMHGEPFVEDVVVDPTGITTRHSTDLLAIEDPEVATAVRYIRENACRGIRVNDVLDQVALSRRALEKRFSQVIGRPPHEEIRRVQLERVKQLLLSTDYKLDRIAEASGFSSAQYLSSLFHRTTSMTPGAWRASGRAGR